MCVCVCVCVCVCNDHKITRKYVLIKYQNDNNKIDNNR